MAVLISKPLTLLAIVAILLYVLFLFIKNLLFWLLKKKVPEVSELQKMKVPKIKINRDELDLKGELLRLGAGQMTATFHYFSILQIDKMIVSRVYADNFLVSFMDVGSDLRIKMYKISPISFVHIVFSVESEEGKYKMRFPTLLLYLFLINGLLLFGGLIVIPILTLIFSILLNFFVGEDSLLLTTFILASTVGLIQIGYTNYKIIANYIKS